LLQSRPNVGGVVALVDPDKGESNKKSERGKNHSDPHPGNSARRRASIGFVVIVSPGFAERTTPSAR